MKSLETATEPELRALSDEGAPLACRWCAKCDHHHRFCQCVEPVWKLRSEGKLGPLPGEAGGPISLTEFLLGLTPP